MSDLLGLLGITEDQARAFVDACEDEPSLAYTPAVSKIAAAVRASVRRTARRLARSGQLDLVPLRQRGYWMGSHAIALVYVLVARAQWPRRPPHHPSRRRRRGAGDYGLFQINKRAWGKLFETHDWKNPLENAQMARKVYDQQGIKAWSTFNNGMS